VTTKDTNRYFAILVAGTQSSSCVIIRQNLVIVSMVAAAAANTYHVGDNYGFVSDLLPIKSFRDCTA
jgi:hypothetical protein